MLELLGALAALVAVQSAPAPEGAAMAWPDERLLADWFGVDLPAGAEGCIAAPESRERLAELLRKAGHAISARSEQSEKSFAVYTEPQLHFGRLIYHYVSVGEGICLKGLCLSSYAGRIEVPVAADGRTVPTRALNDPDRTTLSLFEAVEDIAKRCSSGV